jgi:hypothetical protein
MKKRVNKFAILEHLTFQLIYLFNNFFGGGENESFHVTSAFLMLIKITLNHNEVQLCWTICLNVKHGPTTLSKQ